MKAKMWLKKLNSPENVVDVERAFVEETEQLVKERTKFSNEKTRGGAIDGVIREQSRKWLAVSNKTSLTLSPFKELINSHAPTLAEEYARFLTKKDDKQETEQVEKGVPGRAIADSLSPSPAEVTV